MYDYDVIIIGGGLAGLTAALHLRKYHYNIAVFESLEYPHHKVCGEYVSMEIIPYLESLDVSLPKNIYINEMLMSTEKGTSISAQLPLGGLGISRYTLDYTLYKKAILQGVTILQKHISSIKFGDPTFTVADTRGGHYTSKFVIGAYGKREALDKNLNRDFIQGKSPWLGVKAHYKLDSFPENLVALHNFRGGYGGLSKTESGAVNFCYLVSYDSFKSEKNMESFQQNILAKNPYLNKFIMESEMLFSKPLTIAQISFGKKSTIENHILMCGDTAGLIHPFCGNGMAMAVHSAKMAAELIHLYFTKSDYDRHQLEKEYNRQWHKIFGKRIWVGRQLQRVLLNETISPRAMQLINYSPYLVSKLIKATHGKTIDTV
ncbi:MAG: NAD(P)/FAD-dependent oxidoreductase [Arenibacter latericius]|nr:NAD(P)/FAD-dependent oxidoreductase [Arenibacter latericius]